MNKPSATTNARKEGTAGMAVMERPESSSAPLDQRGALRRMALRTEEAALPPALAAQVRRQFFCCAGEAARYRVGVDEVIEHVSRAGLALGPRPQRAISHLPDVIVAVACARGDAAAWNDLLNAHAWCLDRACAEQMGPSRGLAFARRFWSDLRAATLARGRDLERDGSRTRLQSYSGTRPIRLWLADRLLGGAALADSGASTMPRRLDSGCGSRTLPLPTADAGGTAT